MDKEELIAVEIGLTPSAIRMLKAYAAMSGKSAKEVTEDLSQQVSEVFETQLKSKIASILGIEPAPAPQPRRVAMIATTEAEQPFSDTTGISDGLGDEDPEDPQGESDEAAFVPSSGGLTDADIQKDMAVENPRVEAAGEPLATWQDQMAQGDGGTELFAAAAGIDATNDNRLGKRRKKSLGKGKVTSLTEGNLNSSEASA